MPLKVTVSAESPPWKVRARKNDKAAKWGRGLAEVWQMIIAALIPLVPLQSDETLPKPPGGGFPRGPSECQLSSLVVPLDSVARMSGQDTARSRVQVEEQENWLCASILPRYRLRSRVRRRRLATRQSALIGLKVEPRRIKEMELTFLGTRGGIEIRSRRHRLHSALLVEQDDFRIMIDCGADWLHRLHAVAPSAIVLTHAHADHAAGLVNGAPCPVYAPAATWGLLGCLPIWTGARCRCERPWSLAAFASAPFPSSTQFALPLLAIACRQTIAASSTCLTSPNYPRPLMCFAGLTSISVTAQP